MVQEQKTVVTPAWISQSIAIQKRLPYEEYAAICVLGERPKDHTDQASPSHISSPLPSTSRSLSYISRFAVQRASPLVCPNQAILVQLDVIRNARALDGDERSAMSYSRSMAVRCCRA